MTAVKYSVVLLVAMFGLTLGMRAEAARPAAGSGEAMNLENGYSAVSVGADARTAHFKDKASGKDYLSEPSAFAVVKVAGKSAPATSASFAGGLLTLGFGDTGAKVVLKAETHPHYFTFEVVSVSGDAVEELSFANFTLSIKGDPQEPFAACALALNLQTNVPELPESGGLLRAFCYRRFGFKGAKVAIIACPTPNLRKVMQEVVTAAPELPHSSIGGPWALDSDINRGSYLFNFGGMSEETVDDWIRLAKTLGITQIDFHGGDSFRFGDMRPNPVTYPKGRASLKAVIDKLHAAGIKAGLHTYAFFIDKSCPWVTPVPDPRLGRDAVFTLTEPLSADSSTVPVAESTEKMSTTTGFFVQNSVTLQADDELIIYTGVSKEAPYGFTGCQRGALGTKAAAHPKGARVGHLRECFGRFVPDTESTLFAEVASLTAGMFNECGFDMIYLDALDGEGALAGPEWGWHYGSKFVFEIWKHLERPALQEMSTFHHHLWFVRSRMGAWDHPVRSYKRFIDLHCRSNENNTRMFLPGHLGWWAVKNWMGAQGEPTFSDDIEYLCGKSIGTGSGLSIMGVDPSTIQTNANLARLGGIIKRYEDLRHANYFPEKIRQKLREPGKEFTLRDDASGKAFLHPATYIKHKFEQADERSHAWEVESPYAKQTPFIRVETLMSAGDYDSPDAQTIAEFADASVLPVRSASPGLTSTFETSKEQLKAGTASGLFTANAPAQTQNATVTGGAGFSQTDHGVRIAGRRPAAWAQAGRVFSPAVSLGDKQAIGVWIYGDGQGELLNFQLRSPEHVSGGYAEHYVDVNFTGWRYFELVEPEGERYDDYTWPFGQMVYWVYRELVNYSQVETFNIWFNNLPPGKQVKCWLGPVKALPLVSATLHSPKVTIGGKTVEFPVDIPSGSYIEFRSMTDCSLYGPDGSLVSKVTPRGEAPEMAKGTSRVSFECVSDANARPRARVTVGVFGEALK